MDAVLVRSASSVAVAVNLQTRAVLAERSSAGKGLRQSSLQYRSQVESLGGSRNFWSSEQPQRRISDEPLHYQGFVDLETFDCSVVEEDCVVEHTQESFVKFLRHYPSADLNLVSQACYLSNLAYIIGEIKV